MYECALHTLPACTPVIFHFMRMLRSSLLIVVLASASHCTPARPQPQPDPDRIPPAPWSRPTLSRSRIPAVYVTQWRQADNRISCALLAFASLGAGSGATSRAATFSGGWAVAFDMPGERSAFGIAGSGSKATDPAYSDWPHSLEWSDGSTAGYGPEGGTGPNQLAYLRVKGQTCLYNVWSRLGVSHLEFLLRQLRYVDLSNR